MDNGSLCIVASIRRRQPSHRELDLAVGQLAPVINDGAGICVESSASFETRRVQRQRERLAQEAIALQFATVAPRAGSVNDVSWPLRRRQGLTLFGRD